MKRRFYSTLLLCGCLLASPLYVSNVVAQGDDPDAKEEDQQPASLIDRVKENPNDVKVLNEYFGTEFRSIYGQINSDPDAAEKALRGLEASLEGIEATEPAAKTLMERARRTITTFDSQIEVARTPLEEIVAKLKENSAEAKTLRTYQAKIAGELRPLTNSDPAKAEEKLAEAKAMLGELSEGSDDAEVKARIEQALKSFASIERSIDRAKRLLELVGQEAKPLEVEAWVNGEPLAEGDLKGKVVLLDFWAVWCGPCIATFPHLREWQETYGDKGLVIVGLTRYYGYQWNDEAGRPTRSKEEVSPEAEQKMLAKFAEEHDLHHRFAIQQGNELSEYYAVSGIPHVVVIDQEGKVRMIRVGSGDQNAKDISGLLAELLAK